MGTASGSVFGIENGPRNPKAGRIKIKTWAHQKRNLGRTTTEPGAPKKRTCRAAYAKSCLSYLT